MLKQYVLDNNIYTLSYCLPNDIPSHIEKVYSYWKADNVDIDKQTKVLEQCVANKTAYKIEDSNNNVTTFLYYGELKSDTYISYAMWLKEKRSFSMLCYYLRMHTTCMTICFYPHKLDINNAPFRFAVSDQSVRAYRNGSNILYMNIYSNKANIIYRRNYEHYNIREL